MVHKIWRQFPETEAKLKKFQPYLLDAVNLDNSRIHKRILALLSSGGKMIRPGIFYLFSEFGQTIDENRLRSGAASLELLHVATLIHDDVVDKSPLRRGVVTIQTDYGSKNAIYAGDFLFTCYFSEVLKSSDQHEIFVDHMHSMKNILSGELKQMDLNFKQDITVDEYLDEIKGKTAELFKLSFQQAAKLTHCSAPLISLGEKVGLLIGQAYQILDDILDYDGNSTKTKKPVLEDIQAGVYTLPLILAIKNNPQAFKKILNKKDKMTAEEANQVADLVRANNGPSNALKMANQMSDQALDLLAKLPEQRAKDDLIKLVKLMLHRDE